MLPLKQPRVSARPRPRAPVPARVRGPPGRGRAGRDAGWCAGLAAPRPLPGEAVQGLREAVLSRSRARASISDIVAKTTSLARNLCLKPKQTLKVWTRTSFMLQRGKRRSGRLHVPAAPRACASSRAGTAPPWILTAWPFWPENRQGRRPAAGMLSARHQAVSSWGAAGAGCVCAGAGRPRTPGAARARAPSRSAGHTRLSLAPVGSQGPETGPVDCKLLHLGPNSRLFRYFKRSYF